jgi:prephenate dehydrogenase
MNGKTGTPPPNRMAIIGFGRMGKQAARLFAEGFHVQVISSRDVRAECAARRARQSDSPDESLAQADFIFLAVPIDVLDLWIPRINETSRQDCVVIDCCTVRRAAEERLCKVNRRRFGMPELHGSPLPVEGGPDQRISRYLQRTGIGLRPVAPEEDKGTPVIGMAHFIGMALDLNLTEQDRSALARSKAGSYILQLIEHLKSNSPSTYREIQLMDPRMPDGRKELIDWLKGFDEELNRGVFRFEAYPRERW